MLIVSQRERMILVERKVEDLTPKQQVEALTREMASVKEKFTQTLTKLTTLERAGPQGLAGNNRKIVSHAYRTSHQILKCLVKLTRNSRITCVCGFLIKVAVVC